MCIKQQTVKYKHVTSVTTRHKGLIAVTAANKSEKETKNDSHIFKMGELEKGCRDG
jgi:hypothetical protein